MVVRRAYSRMRLPDGTLVEGPLAVREDAGAGCWRWHLLEGEEPFTEWAGGTWEPAPGTDVRREDI